MNKFCPSLMHVIYDLSS